MTTAAPTDRSFRAKILDVREQRRMAVPLEYRTNTENGRVLLEGYAATFTPYEVMGGPKSGGWNETINQRAFDKTLGSNPDVLLLLNHEGLPLARTKSGTMDLSVDSHGLLVRAELDPSDPDVQRLMPKMRRGDMDEMSFAFRVRDQEWDNSYTQRTIKEVSLMHGDVSVCNYGMNHNTAAMLSTEAIDAIAQLSSDDLLEIRKMDRSQVKRALAVLQRAARPASGGAAARASTPKKYADVSNFADPGYLDNQGKPAKGGNGKKRYPLNSAARVRNAAARFAQNKGRYTSEQQSAIMGKIKSAAKRFGVTISDESKGQQLLAGVDHIDLQPNAAGGTTLVAVMSDGTRTPLPSTKRGTPFTGAPYTWRPDDWPIDPHDEEFSKETHAMADCNDPDCTNPDHDHEDRQAGNFGGKQAKPFGGDDEDEDEDRQFPDCAEEMGEYEGTDAEAAIADDEDEDEHEDDADSDADEHIDLALVDALESTIVNCYKLAEGDDELRKLLRRARRQVSELRGEDSSAPPAAPKPGSVSTRLAELRAMTGESAPGTLTVAEGLKALRETGFADTMKPAS